MSKDFATEEEGERESSKRDLLNGSKGVATPEYITTRAENAINAHKAEPKKTEDAEEAEEASR